MMTGESEGSGITWRDWGVSEFEKWTVWTLNDKVNEWWFLLVLVIIIKLICLILPPLQCLHTHSMSLGHVLCLPLACHAGWVRGSGSYKAVHSDCWVYPDGQGVFISFIVWPSNWLKYRFQSLQAVCIAAPAAAACCVCGPVPQLVSWSSLGAREEDGKWHSSRELCVLGKRGLKLRMSKMVSKILYAA